MDTHPPSHTRIFLTRRAWLPLLLALGLLAALWLALSWPRAGRAEVEDIGIFFQDATVDHGEGDCGVGKEMLFVVQAGGLGNYPVHVNYEVVAGGDGTATPDVDFVTITDGMLIIDENPPSNIGEIKVQILCDSIDEPDEQFAVHISTADQNVIILDNTAIGTIIDDDVPQVSIDDLTLVEGGDWPPTFGSLHLTIDPPPYQTVELTYRTVADTASPEEFQAALNEPLLIPAGTTSLPLDVAVYGDRVDEVDDLERFFVVLTSTNLDDIYVSDNLSGTVQIQDDDFASFNLQPARLMTYEKDSAPFYISLDTVPEQSVTLQISHNGGTIDSRLAVTPTLVTFDQDNYDLALPVWVQGLDNHIEDPPETFKVYVNPAPSLDLPYKNLATQEVHAEVRDADANFLFAGFMLNDYRVPFDYQETFDSSIVLQYWLLLNGEHEWQNGAYLLKQLTPGFNTRSVAPVSNINVDYSVEVDVAVPESADPYTRVGVLFDFKSNVEFYRFIIRPAVNEYKLEKFSLNEGYTTLTFGNSTAINGGHGSNRLRVERRGAAIWLFINDLPLNSSPIIDTTYQYGRVGLIIVAPDVFVNTPLAAGEFDNFAVLELHD